MPTTLTEPWRDASDSDCAVPVSAAKWTIWEGVNSRRTASQSGAWVTSPVNKRTDDGNMIARDTHSPLDLLADPQRGCFGHIQEVASHQSDPLCPTGGDQGRSGQRIKDGRGDVPIGEPHQRNAYRGRDVPTS